MKRKTRCSGALSVIAAELRRLVYGPGPIIWLLPLQSSYLARPGTIVIFGARSSSFCPCPCSAWPRSSRSGSNKRYGRREKRATVVQKTISGNDKIAPPCRLPPGRIRTRETASSRICKRFLIKRLGVLAVPENSTDRWTWID